MAEVRYVCLTETNLQLAGVADDEREEPFLGWLIHRTVHLMGTTLEQHPPRQLVIMLFAGVKDKLARVAGRGVPLSRVRAV